MWRLWPNRNQKNNVYPLESLVSEKTKDLLLKNAAIESSTIGIAIGDLEGKIVYVNPEFVNMWGHSQTESTGMNALDFWESPDRAAESLKEVIERCKWDGELIARRKDNSTFVAQVYANKEHRRRGHSYRY